MAINFNVYFVPLLQPFSRERSLLLMGPLLHQIRNLFKVHAMPQVAKIDALPIPDALQMHFSSNKIIEQHQIQWSSISLCL